MGIWEFGMYGNLGMYYGNMGMCVWEFGNLGMYVWEYGNVRATVPIFLQQQNLFFQLISFFIIIR